MSQPILSLMAAVGEGMVIGKENALPWHLPSDLRYFRRVTMGKPVIMGRKTLESLGKPLGGRKNIILTHQRDYEAEGVHIAHDLDEALALAGDVDEVMILGGGKVYVEFLPRADRLYLTVVHARFEGDTFFPNFDEEQWEVTCREHHEPDEKNKYPHTFVVLERRAPKPVHVEELSAPRELPGILEN
ncbi:MAG: type 3 dihydrofolate reductase [Bradymonadaceae bacterium]